MLDVLAVLWRPRTALRALAARPRLRLGLLAVLAAGLGAMGVEIAASAVSGDATAAIGVTVVQPLLLLTYWLVAGWLIDASARMLDRPERRRAFLGVSGATFPALLAYPLLQLLEAASRLWTGGDDLARALAWLNLPLLGWFVVLTALAVRAVYDVPPLNAAAMAMLPAAALTAALIVLQVALAGLRAGGLG